MSECGLRGSPASSRTWTEGRKGGCELTARPAQLTTTACWTLSNSWETRVEAIEGGVDDKRTSRGLYLSSDLVEWVGGKGNGGELDLPGLSFREPLTTVSLPSTPCPSEQRSHQRPDCQQSRSLHRPLVCQVDRTVVYRPTRCTLRDLRCETSVRARRTLQSTTPSWTAHRQHRHSGHRSHADVESSVSSEG